VICEAYRDTSPANMKRLAQVMVYDSSYATDELAEARSRAALAKPEQPREANRFSAASRTWSWSWCLG
jgi:hypothetical protein